MLLTIAVLIAIPIGYFLDGELRNYLNNPLKMLILPCIAFILEASLDKIAESVSWPVNYWLGCAVCIEYMLLAIFIWLNKQCRGIGLLGFGMLLNFAAIADNGFRMPVSPIIYNFPDAAGIADKIARGEVIGYTLVDWDARLWFLGDTIPLLSGLASIGDLLMALALIIIVVDKMLTRPKRKKRRPSKEFA